MMSAVHSPNHSGLIPDQLPPAPSHALPARTLYVVAAAHRPTTLFEECAAVMGDIVAGSVIVLALVAAPVLVVQAITAAMSFILPALGRS